MFTVPGMCLTMLRIFGDLLYLATDLKLIQSSKIDDIKDVVLPVDKGQVTNTAVSAPPSRPVARHDRLQ